MLERPLRARHAAHLAGAFLVAALALDLTSSWLASQYSQFYAGPYDTGGVQQWRQALLDARIAALPTFVLLVAIASASFGLALRALARPSPAWGQVAVTCGLVALAALAGYVSHAEWLALRRPCWDGYCDYAAHIRAVIDTGGAPHARASLLAFMRSDYHSNSPGVPLMTAIVSWAAGLHVLTVYRALMGLSTLGALIVAARWIWPRWGHDAEVRAAQLALMLGNVALIRCSMFPQTDAMLLLVATLVLAVGLELLEARRVWHVPTLIVFGVVGVFIKLSFLPWLLVVPMWRALDARWRGAPVVRALIVDGLVLVGPALIWVVAFQTVMGTHAMYALELERARNLDFHLPFILCALVQVVAPQAQLAWWGRARLARRDHLMLAAVALYLVALWVSGAAGQDRYYLPIVPAAVALSGHGLARLRALGMAPLWVFLVAATALSHAIFRLGLYY